MFNILSPKVNVEIRVFFVFKTLGCLRRSSSEIYGDSRVSRRTRIHAFNQRRNISSSPYIYIILTLHTERYQTKEFYPECMHPKIKRNKTKTKTEINTVVLGASLNLRIVIKSNTYRNTYKQSKHILWILIHFLASGCSDDRACCPSLHHRWSRLSTVQQPQGTWVSFLFLLHNFSKQKSVNIRHIFSQTMKYFELIFYNVCTIFTTLKKKYCIYETSQ